MNINLTPHSEELLKRHLQLGQFHSQEEVIERALETLADRINGEGTGAPARPKRTREEFHVWLDQFAAYSDRIPPLGGETFSCGTCLPTL
jgi:hypothetical protein